MQTILLSMIAGILALDFISKNIDFDGDLVWFWIIVNIVLILISGAVIFGIVYGLDFLFGTTNIY